MNKNDLSKSPKKTKNKEEQNNPNIKVRGLPGYRTRDGRSGYDPIDTRAEAAHSAGTIIQKLFSGRFRNPFHLFLVGALGLALITPLILAISEVINGNQFPLNAWAIFLVTGVVGLGILINFVKKLITRPS